MLRFIPHRTALVTGSSSRATARCSDSSDSSFSPPSAVPQALSFSPEKSDFTFSKSIAEEVALDEAQPLEDMAPGEVNETHGVRWCQGLRSRPGSWVVASGRDPRVAAAGLHPVTPGPPCQLCAKQEVGTSSLWRRKSCTSPL